MGFFDKLFGRSKDVAEDVGQKAEEYGGEAYDKAKDAAGDVGQKAEETYDAAKDKIGGGEGKAPETPQPPQNP